MLSVAVSILLSSLGMVSRDMPLAHCAREPSETVAAYVPGEITLDAAHPAAEWNKARPIVFCSDWQGKNPDEQRETHLRVLWSAQTLYLRFDCKDRDLHWFAEPEPNGRRDHLWDRDVTEAFLQPDPVRKSYYREFEVSPNGMWIDLDIFPGGLADLKSGLTKSVIMHENDRRWSAELAIPMKALTRGFDPRVIWRANFYRVEGTGEGTVLETVERKKGPRAYLAWQPTGTAEPNFHVPKRFGRLRFGEAGGDK